MPLDWLKKNAMGLLGLGADIYGGSLDRELAMDMHRENIAYQKMFAQHGVRWRVQDARAAGIHPLAALGVSPVGFRPSNVGGRRGETGIGKIGKYLMELQFQKNRSDVGLQKAQADYYKAMAEDIRGKGKDVPDSVKESKMVISSRTPGIEVDQQPLKADYLHPSGYNIPAAGKDASEPMESDVTAQMRNLGLEFADWLNGWKSWLFARNDNKTRKYLLQMMRRRPAVPKDKIGTHEYRYNVGAGMFVLRKKTRPQGYFWDHGTPLMMDVPNNPFVPQQRLQRTKRKKPSLKKSH